MFERIFKSKRYTPMTDPPDIIVTAAAGFSVFYFAPTPEQKPSLQLLTEMTRGSGMQPVLAWRYEGGRADPVTIFPRPADAQRYLFVGGKIYSLDGEPQSWASFDLFAGWLIGDWTKKRGVQEPQPVSFIPGRRSEIVQHA
jgi:hypothetical protein